MQIIHHKNSRDFAFGDLGACLKGRVWSGLLQGRLLQAPPSWHLALYNPQHQLLGSRNSYLMNSWHASLGWVGHNWWSEEEASVRGPGGPAEL